MATAERSRATLPQHRIRRVPSGLGEGGGTFAVGPGIFWRRLDMGLRARISAADARTERPCPIGAAVWRLEERMARYRLQRQQRARSDSGLAKASEKAMGLARLGIKLGWQTF